MIVQLLMQGTYFFFFFKAGPHQLQAGTTLTWEQWKGWRLRRSLPNFIKRIECMDQKTEQQQSRRDSKHQPPPFFFLMGEWTQDLP